MPYYHCNRPGSIRAYVPAEEVPGVFTPELGLSCQEQLDMLETSVHLLSRAGPQEGEEGGWRGGG